MEELLCIRWYLVVKVLYFLEPSGPLPCLQKPLPWATLIQSILSHCISVISNWIFQSMHRAFKFPFSPKLSMNFSLSPIRMSCITNLTLRDLVIVMCNEYKFWNSLLCFFSQTPITFSHLGPKVIRNTLFLNTFSLYPSLNVRNQISHAYKTAAKIMLLYILMFMFLSIIEEE